MWRRSCLAMPMSMSMSMSSIEPKTSTWAMLRTGLPPCQMCRHWTMEPSISAHRTPSPGVRHSGRTAVESGAGDASAMVRHPAPRTRRSCAGQRRRRRRPAGTWMSRRRDGHAPAGPSAGVWWASTRPACAADRTTSRWCMAWPPGGCRARDGGSPQQRVCRAHERLAAASQARGAGLQGQRQLHRHRLPAHGQAQALAGRRVCVGHREMTASLSISSDMKPIAVVGHSTSSKRTGCAPCQSTCLPSAGRCSRPSVMVRKWLPASWPILLEKLQAP